MSYYKTISTGALVYSPPDIRGQGKKCKFCNEEAIKEMWSGPVCQRHWDEYCTTTNAGHQRRQ